MLRLMCCYQTFMQISAQEGIEAKNIMQLKSSSRFIRTIGAYRNAATGRLATKVFRPMSYSAIQADAHQKQRFLNRHNLPDDKLILQGMMFHGFHGVHAEEKKLGQKFLVDIDAWLDLRKAGETDDLNDSVNYAEVYRIVKGIMEGPSHALLESVATSIAKGLLNTFPAISSVRIKIGKPHVALEGVLDYLGVEIYRAR